MPATAPTDLANLVLPYDLDTMPRRDIVAFFDAHGLAPMNARQSAESLRALLRDVTATARRDREWQERCAVQHRSEARRAPVYAQVEGSFTCTTMPRRAISDALHAVEAAAGGGFVSANDSDGREASLLWSLDRLVAVLRAAADPTSEVTLEDALLEAVEAEETASRARRDAARARENVEARLRGILRTLEGGR